jgi:hypothetical protein
MSGKQQAGRNNNIKIINFLWKGGYVQIFGEKFIFGKKLLED